MGHYILIDAASGYIFYDSRDLAAYSNSEHGPIDAARIGDESIGVRGRRYEMLTSKPNYDATGYEVYRVDINGSEAVTNIRDGQDQDTIDEVERECDHVGFIRVTD